MNAVTITSAASYRDLYFVHADGIERGPMPLADALAASARSLTASAGMLTERQPAFSPDSPDFELSERERADAEDGAAGDHKSYTTDFDHDSYMS